MTSHAQHPICQPFTIASHKEPESEDAEARTEGKEYGEIGCQGLGNEKQNDTYRPEPEMAEHVGHGIKNDRRGCLFLANKRRY